MSKITVILIFFTILMTTAVLVAKTHELYSPDKRIQVQVDLSETISFAVHYDGRSLLEAVTIAMKLKNGIVLGEKPTTSKVETKQISEIIQPAVPEKRKTVKNQCNELSLRFNNNYDLLLRAYNDGVAYRFVTNFDNRIKVESETARFVFSERDSVFFPFETSLHTSFEKNYGYVALNDIKSEEMAFLPILVDIAGGPKVAVTEVDLYDYPGMWLTGSDDQPALDAKFAPYPVKETKTRDRKLEVTETADYIADTEGKRAFPWRLLVIAEKDGDLVETDIVFRLSPEQQLQDTSWLKPGKIAWDWWNALNVTGVDFKSGVNTESYKHYIDFAAENGIEYIILDEGWSPTEDLLKEVPDVNVPELVAYGDKKGVRLILWCVWLAVDKQLEEAFQLFHTWGIAGAKIDFMDRDDQKMVDYYWRVTREAARYKLLVDYHGAYKPTGLRRAWPNLMTREGVIGLEYNKWSEKSSPENALCIPFIRMLAGPMDYTPGAMRNAQKANFKPIFERPMSQGTRCHQLAMYVVYESPLQMLSDTPSNYRRYPDILNFIAAVPTIWDETKVLSAKAGDYIIVARQSGNDWYMGAMTDWTARTLTVDFSFLEDDVYNGQIFQDGLNADRHAEDYKFTECKISKSDQMQIKLAPGGGWAAKITK